eukprot:XP_014769992.1 PREDICTED: inactive tyrosine-protein kinase transmembrane receptor ROR1-like isoform X1 [Octopus bimaculoides]
MTYKGYFNFTKSKHPCQNWSLQTPHKHNFNVANSTQLGDHNFCRNPGNEEDRPWCFTTNENVRKEICDIRNCDGFVEVNEPMKNVTAYKKDTVRLECEITGKPVPKYNWTKDDKPLPHDPRYRVRETYYGSRLKILDVSPKDSGLFLCIASNRFGQKNTTGRLRVKDEISTKKMIDRIPDSSGRQTPSTPFGSSSEEQNNQGSCFDYHGTPCAKFLANKSVYVANKNGLVETEKVYTVAVTMIGQSTDLSPRCQQFAILSLCYHAFPLCDETSAIPKPRLLCKDECKILREDICKNEYKMAKGHPLIGEKLLPKCENLAPVGTKEAANCIEIGVRNATRVTEHSCYNGSGSNYRGMISRTRSGHECQKWSSNNPHLHHFKPTQYPELGDHNYCRNPGNTDHAPWCFTLNSQVKKERCDIPRCDNRHRHMTYWKDIDINCYTNKGSTYQGKVSKTKSGWKCQSWNTHYPHNHPYSSTDYPELRGGHNYCRNPGGVLDTPWCYTTESSVVKEECNISKCPHGITEDVNKLMFILVPGITVPLALVLLLALVCFCQRSHNRYQGTSDKASQRQGQPMELSPLAAKSNMRTREFFMQNIRFIQELGEGAFGKVYKGELVGLFSENSVTKVAIKTLKENASPKVQNDFRREVDLMSEMRHSNIVCLLGVCMKQEPMCMLFEYMSQGDLHEYLITHSPHSDITGIDEEGNRVLDYLDMLHIAIQIASGMEYLSNHHFVHRDLAARNILVGDALTVKISDFGLSRDIYSSDYYRVQSKSLLPVRWMPPESILYGKFTTESDVWSFGVVLWEIFSYGLQPYYGYSNQEVIDMIRSRQILRCPENCNAHIYALKVECWHELPSRRPSFREINARLRAIKMEAMNQNPHWSISQSQSAHSSSTHQSSHSQPSHQSSVGPSNTTATTGLTSSSNNSEPNQQQGNNPPVPMANQMMPPHGYVPNQMPLTPTPTQQIMMMQQQQQQQRAPPTYGGQQMKVSPAGSVASHPSSANSSSSQGSSTSHGMTQMAPPSVTGYVGNNLSAPPNMMGSDCHKMANYITHQAHIPDSKPAAEI